MADLKMMLQNLRDKSKCCKKDDFTGERYTIIHDMSIETLNMICEDGIEQLENEQAVNRWIPCSERLPEQEVRVLLFAADEVYVGELTDIKDLFDTDIGFMKNGHVTHWMPLLEPPEKE